MYYNKQILFNKSFRIPHHITHSKSKGMSNNRYYAKNKRITEEKRSIEVLRCSAFIKFLSENHNVIVQTESSRITWFWIITKLGSSLTQIRIKYSSNVERHLFIIHIYRPFISTLGVFYADMRAYKARILLNILRNYLQ